MTLILLVPTGIPLLETLTPALSSQVPYSLLLHSDLKKEKKMSILLTDLSGCGEVSAKAGSVVGHSGNLVCPPLSGAGGHIQWEAGVSFPAELGSILSLRMTSPFSPESCLQAPKADKLG